MNRLFPLVAALCAMLAPSNCAASKEDDYLRIAQEMPSGEALLKFLQVLEHPDEHDEFNVQHARQWIEVAKKKIPEIENLIEEGTSIFSYPGLLTRGKIEHSEPLPGNRTAYTLYWDLSIDAPGFPPHQLRIMFDKWGVITAVQKVPFVREPPPK